jgi:hypothetical protein
MMPDWSGLSFLKRTKLPNPAQKLRCRKEKGNAIESDGCGCSERGEDESCGYFRPTGLLLENVPPVGEHAILHGFPFQWQESIAKSKQDRGRLELRSEFDRPVEQRAVGLEEYRMVCLGNCATETPGG